MSMTYKNILVAVDETNESLIAFRRAVQVVLNNVGSKLYIVHVIDTRSFAFSEGYNFDMAEKITNNKKDLLDSYEKKAQQSGLVNIKKLIEYGTPKHVIARDIPQQEKIDLIICGVTGKGELARLFLGSVSEGILRNARCDVLVVRNS
ncbi:universal stress protein [Solibacillus sp. FSL W7-1472]|uniref:Universal stress protein n=1 Tax=Solibacillus isronensis B3W22 TaxID=1224748 RepID=K1KM58_9BACL|nr:MULTISPECIES: universal stress protein [Solibacillus]AMO86069.1 universal stress protein UspA [Solibacillus silvestris]EKB43601.1 Putative universal stress protein [Solibacillus isronensis B3W22]OBW59983.1 universal stress protein UspA [Solibacillus silvestris]